MTDTAKIKLVDLIDDVKTRMLSENYAVGTIGVYKSIWNKLLRFSKSEYYNRGIALQFLEKNYSITDQMLHDVEIHLPKKQRGALRAINVLEDFYQNRRISFRYYRMYDPKRIGSVPESIHTTFFNEYMKYFYSQQPSVSWEKSTILGLGTFLQFLYHNGIDSPQEIDIVDPL